MKRYILSVLATCSLLIASLGLSASQVSATAPTPTVTDANISLSSTPSGAGGTVYKIGDSVTAVWNNTAGGDNNLSILSVTVDFSQFGGGSSVAATESPAGIWTATYVIAPGTINDVANRNVSLTATNVGGPTTVSDTSNETVDNQAPTATVTLETNILNKTSLVQGVTLTYDELMDVSASPTISFSGNSGTMTPNGDGAWNASSTVWTEHFTLTDVSEQTVGVTVNSSGANDIAGNMEGSSVGASFDIDTLALTVTTLGDGSAPYALPFIPSFSRPTLHGATLIFNEAPSAGGKTAVESALTAGSDKTLTYVWGTGGIANRLRLSYEGVSTTDTATFVDNVFVDATDTAGNLSHLWLINSVMPSETFVNESYTLLGANDGHRWGFDAFTEVQEGIAAVATSGTVHVGPGTYDSDNTTINKAITLSGTGIDAVASSTIQNTACDYVLTIQATDVTVSGFHIKQLDGPSAYCHGTAVVHVDSGSASTTVTGNEIAGGTQGVLLRWNSSGNVVTNNLFHDNQDGVYFESSRNGLISGNEIYENSNDGIHFTSGSCDSCDGVVSGNTVTNNNVHDNYYGIVFDNNLNFDSVHITDNNIHDNPYGFSSYGIILGDNDVANSTTTPLMITGNTVTANTNGIRIQSGVQDVTISGNTITNNGTGPSAIDTFSDLDIHVNGNVISGNSDGVIFSGGLSAFDATANYWGSSTGPTNTSNSGGTGDTVNADVNFRPYYTDVGLTTLSNFSVPSDDLQGLFGNGGSFSIPVGEASTSVSQITVNEDVVISVATEGGTSSVNLPQDTVITKVGGGTIDASQLTATDTATGDLSGLGSGTVVDGALQWGIVDLGLEFSQPITLHIFVGTSHNGETLSVKRSTTSTSGWTDDGIVSPKTCVVSSGICTFQTLKASFFAVVTPPPAPAPTMSHGGGSSGGAGGLPPPVTTYQIYTYGNASTTVTTPAPLVAAPQSQVVQLYGPSSTGVFTSPADLRGLLIAVNASENPVVAARSLLQVKADAKQFGVTVSAAQAQAMANFVAYGMSDRTVALGSGERRALLRDYLETVKHGDVVWSDVELLANGQIPVSRNLNAERAQLTKVRATFRQIFGHDPVFSNPTENLVWNTLMYRIRFTRDLGLETKGIKAYVKLFGHNPTTPFGWAVVRALGYVK